VTSAASSNIEIAEEQRKEEVFINYGCPFDQSKHFDITISDANFAPACLRSSHGTTAHYAN
jgi:hypothetical protein